MRRPLALMIVVVSVLACSDELGPEDGLSGTFDFHFDFVLVTQLPPGGLGPPGDSNAFDPGLVELSCQGDGGATLTASGSAFNGVFQQTGTCEKPDGAVASAGSGAIENGLVDGSRVQFEIRPCVFDGDLQGGPSWGAAGTVACVVNHPRIRLTYHGSWFLRPSAEEAGTGS